MVEGRASPPGLHAFDVAGADRCPILHQNCLFDLKLVAGAVGSGEFAKTLAIDCLRAVGDWDLDRIGFVVFNANAE